MNCYVSISVFSNEHCYCWWRKYVHHDVILSLFLPRESTLVVAGHVSARFFQIPEKWLEGGAGQLKFVSTELTSWAQYGVEFVTSAELTAKALTHSILEFNASKFGLKVSPAFGWIFPSIAGWSLEFVVVKIIDKELGNDDHNNKWTARWI